MQTVTLFAIIFAAWQLLFHSRQMHREFEHLYVERYWDLMDKRSTDFVLDGIVGKEDRPIVRGYLQLCEDELDLRRLGRITDNTWQFWGVSIRDQVTDPVYKSELETLDVSTYPLLRTFIALDCKDPLNWKWLWRKLHGL